MIRGRARGGTEPKGGKNTVDKNTVDKNTVYKGIHWHRDAAGAVGFYDQASDKWVQWVPGVDSPPLPPRWQMFGVPTKVARPRWRSPWRVVPVVLIAAAVVIAVVQSFVPSGQDVAKRERAALSLVGKCLAQTGAQGGHPVYRASPVSCSSSQAKVKVAEMFPLTAGRLCGAGTVGYEAAFVGVPYAYVECLQPLSGSS